MNITASDLRKPSQRQWLVALLGLVSGIGAAILLH